MKASTLLTMQHHGILELCDAVAFGTVSMRETLLPQLALDLSAHVRVEEELLYPLAERALADDHDVALSNEQRSLAKRYMRRLLDTPVGDARFQTQALELRDVVERHAREEEGVMLPRLEKRISPAESRALASRMMRLHHASLEGSIEREASPDGDTSFASHVPELTPPVVESLSTLR